MKLPKKFPLPKDRTRPPPWFWEIIAECQQSPDRLREIMKDAPASGLIAFSYVWRWAARAPAIWDLGWKLDPEASEDSILDLAEWIIAQGEAVYLQVLAGEALPVALPSFPPRPPALLGVVEDLHDDRYHCDIPAPPE